MGPMGTQPQACRKLCIPLETASHKQKLHASIQICTELQADKTGLGFKDLGDAGFTIRALLWLSGRSAPLILWT